MSTFLQLCQKTARECGVPGGGPASVLTQTGILLKIVGWVADSDELIQNKWADWGFLSAEFSTNTIVGTNEYAAPADFGAWDEDSAFLDYSTDDYSQLTIIPYKEWRSFYRPGNNSNEKPGFFTINQSNSLILEPKPDAIYSLTADYWTKAVKMTANADTSKIPAQYERAIISRAKIFYAEDQEAEYMRGTASAEYADILRRLEAAQLPGQGNNTRAEGEEMVVIPQ